MWYTAHEQLMQLRWCKVWMIGKWFYLLPLSIHSFTDGDCNARQAGGRFLTCTTNAHCYFSFFKRWQPHFYYYHILPYIFYYYHSRNIAGPDTEGQASSISQLSSSDDLTEDSYYRQAQIAKRYEKIGNLECCKRAKRVTYTTATPKEKRSKTIRAVRF